MPRVPSLQADRVVIQGHVNTTYSDASKVCCADNRLWTVSDQVVCAFKSRSVPVVAKLTRLKFR